MADLTSILDALRNLQMALSAMPTLTPEQTPEARLTALERYIDNLVREQQIALSGIDFGADEEMSFGGRVVELTPLVPPPPRWQPTPPILLPEVDHFVAKITGNATDGDNKWKYAWSEVRQSAAGYGNWATFTGGRSGTTSTDPARNLLEDMNAATGVQGNGVDVANLDSDLFTFTIQPVPTNALVVMYAVDATDNTLAYWFQASNGVDGGCD